VVSGVTVPYANTSDLEIYIGKGKVESIEVTNAGAGYTDRKRASGSDRPRVLVFSGGSGGTDTTPTAPSGVYTTVGENNSGRDSGTFDGKYYVSDATDSATYTFPAGSGYTVAPNVGVENFDSGTGAQFTAKIYAKKASGTDYTLSGTSGNTTITFTSALADADKVLIKRATGVSTAANTFAAGSAITAEALNKSFDQIRYKVEELPNVTSTAVTNGDKGDIVVSGNTWSLENSSITEAKIGNLQVTSGKIAGDAINGDKIADDSINSEHYAAGSIDEEHIANSQVTFAKIQNIPQDTVLGRTDTGSGVVSAIQVDKEMIAGDAIDGTKIADDSINSEHYVDGSIDLAHMSSESVDEDNLKISNAGTNGNFLSKQSGDTGGLTWANPFAVTGTGILVNVEQVVLGSTQSSTSTSYVDVPGLTITKDVTSVTKLLIILSGQTHGSNADNNGENYAEGKTQLVKEGVLIGPEMWGERGAVSISQVIIDDVSGQSGNKTYKLQQKRHSHADNGSTNVQAGSSITLIEIK